MFDLTEVRFEISSPFTIISKLSWFRAQGGRITGSHRSPGQPPSHSSLREGPRKVQGETCRSDTLINLQEILLTEMLKKQKMKAKPRETVSVKNQRPRAQAAPAGLCVEARGAAQRQPSLPCNDACTPASHPDVPWWVGAANSNVGRSDIQNTV